MRFKYYNTYKDSQGNALSGGSATVYTDSGALATIYSAETGGSAVAGSIITTDTNGAFEFYVDTIDYPLTQQFNVTVSKLNYSSSSITDITIFPSLQYRYIADPSETDQGIAGAGNTINALVDAIASDVETIYLPPGSYTLTTSETIPSNVTLLFAAGAVIDGAGTLTGTQTPINAGLSQIFGSSLTLAGTWDVTEAYPEWWGAAGDGTTDDTTEIQAAIDFMEANNGGSVLLTKNTYIITTLSINDGVVLEGTTKGDTELRSYTRIKQSTAYTTNPAINFVGTGTTSADRVHGAGLKNIMIDRDDQATGTKMVYLEFCTFMNFENVQIEGGDFGLFITETYDSNFSWVIIRSNNTSLTITTNDALGGTPATNSNNLKFYNLHIESSSRRGIEIYGSGLGGDSINKIDFFSAKVETAPDYVTHSDAACVYIANSADVHFFGGHQTIKAISTTDSTASIIHVAGGTIGLAYYSVNVANNTATPLHSVFKFDASASPNNANSGNYIIANSSIDLYPTNGICYIDGVTGATTNTSLHSSTYVHSGFVRLTNIPLVVYNSSITSFIDPVVAVDINQERNLMALKGRYGSLSGTATAGGASTITLDSSAWQKNDLYNGWHVEITAGTGIGQTNRISDYVGSTRVATVSTAWSTQPDATSVYTIKSLDGKTSDPVLSYERNGLPGYWHFGRMATTDGRFKILNHADLGGSEYGHMIMYGDYESVSGLKRCTGLGGGAWDTGHLLLGTYHLWIDATGDLRIKSSAPTTDLDGVVVGTQT